MNYSLRYVIKIYEVKFCKKKQLFVASRSFITTSWSSWKLFVLQSGIAADVHYPYVFLFVERKGSVYNFLCPWQNSLGRLIFYLSRHTIRHTHSVGLFWTSYEPLTESAPYIDTRDKVPCPQRDSNPHSSNQAAEINKFRPHGHWDRWGVSLPPHTVLHLKK